MNEYYRHMLRFALAGVIVVVAFCLRWVLTLTVGALPPLITIYPAVMIVALFLGVGPGLAATALAAVIAIVAIPPAERFPSPQLPAQLVSLGIFIFSGALLSVVAELYRRARVRTANYEKELALRKSEERVREQYAELCQVYQYSPVGLSAVDRDLRYIRVNKRMAEIDGQPLEAYLGRLMDDVQPADLAASLRGLMQGVLDTGIPVVNCEIKGATHRDPGVQRHFLCSYYPLRSHANEVIGILAAVLETTDRKRAEEEKLRMERSLFHAQKLESLGVLAGGIAHDFNNILAGIMGYADVIRRRLPPGDAAIDDVATIKTAVRRAADLTRQMLAYAGTAESFREQVDVSRVIEDARKMLAVSVSKKAELRFQLAADLPRIYADASQIYQVLLNLVINASEALDDNPGVITVTTSSIAIPTQGHAVRLLVSDTGSGMDRATMDKMFDPFYSTKFAGRGLGLATVHGIVRSHGGTIGVSSTTGQGTTFQIDFPAAGDAPESPAASTASHAEWRGSGTVLVVDDEPLVRGAAQGMIEQAGFSVLTAADGEEAVRVYRDHQAAIVCVLLDLMMPKLDGAETCRALQIINPAVRVILSSGFGEEVARQRFGDLRLMGFVQKPYQVETLLGHLREACQPA